MLQIGKVPRVSVYSSLVFVLAFGLTVSISYYAREQHRDAVREEFRILADEAVMDVDGRMNLYLESMRGARALFSSDGDVSRTEWKRYVDALGQGERLPGIQAFQFCRFVPAEGKEEFEAGVRGDTGIDPRGYPDFSIKPPGDRDYYIVVDYNEPMEGNEKAFGFDTASEPTRRAAAEKAIATGEAVASGKITLVQETGGQQGFLIHLPVYDDGLPLSSPEERRAAFRGFVTSVFRAADFFGGALGQKLGMELYYNVYDGEVSPETDSPEKLEDLLLYGGPVAGEPLSVTVSHRFLDRIWTVHFFPSSHFLRKTASIAPASVFVVGLAVSVLLWGLALFAESRQRTLIFLEKLLDTISLPVFYKDRDLVYRGCNAEFAKEMGVEKGAIVGKTVYDLFPKEHAERMDEKDRQALESGVPVSYEMVAPGADGRLGYYIFRKTPLSSPDGRSSGIVGVAVNITERKEAEEELRKAKDEAEKATAVKDKFVTLVSHDLRAPLAHVIGMLNFIGGRWSEVPSDDREKMIEGAVRNCEGMISMIDHLLDIARLKTGQIKPEQKFINPHAMASEVVDRFSYEAGRKGIGIMNVVPQNLRLYADYNLFYEVLHNLVSNAVKFCREGDTIVIFSPPGEHSTIIVKDSGVGIKKEYLPTILSSSDKVSTPGTDNEKGTGLGLIFVREIVEAHGGTLKVESGDGKGAAFIIKFPVVPFRVLLVDGNENSRMLFRRLLKEEDMEIMEAESSADALALLEKKNPHILVANLLVKGGDGLELLQSVRGNPRTKKLPVIMISGNADPAIKGKAFATGASDFISMPASRHEVVPRIKRFITGAG